MTTLTLSSTDASKLKADAIVVGLARGPQGLVLAPGAAAVDKAFKGKLTTALAGLGAKGKEGEVTRVAGLGALAAGTVVAVGLGEAPAKGAAYDPEVLRRGIGAAVRALAGSATVGTTLAGADGAAGESQVRAVAEGALLGAYAFTRFRSASRADHPEPVGQLVVLVDKPRDRTLKAAVERASAVVAAVGLARDLVNTPPGHLHPADLAAAAQTVAKAAKLDIEVLDEKALAKGGYGGILGVGQGSANPPRLVRLAYRHPKAKRTIALVGKGITFDSGGLSLKPAVAMEWMKSDMGGAAAVIATLQAVAALQPQVNVIGYAPTAENMPSGSAIRPSDVLTSYAGRTIEVLNTDAEGRLILVDGIARAAEDKPDVIIDIATLTGAQLVALGARTAAVMGNDDALSSLIVDAAQRAGEQMWPMPLPKELRASLDSEVADISNQGDRYGGMLVAGLFLQEWVPAGVRWAHLDIAGPAYNQGEAFGYTPKGGTGAAVRTLVQLIEDTARGALG